MIDYLAHWDVPASQAPDMTGAASVMDLVDIREVLDHFGLDLSNRRVVDVGCGTGRLAQVCGDYWGYDIAPGMVAYANQHGARAALIAELPSHSAQADIVCCLSVFTHIAKEDRAAYLAQFATLAPALLVDILPGAESGSPGQWYADVNDFKADLAAAGFKDFETFERIAPSGCGHRYYLASLTKTAKPKARKPAPTKAATVTAIVVANNDEPGLRHILGELRYQTVPPNETIVLCANTPGLDKLREHFPEATILDREYRGDFGHEDRAHGITLATSQWVGFFNSDDSYTTDYLERMLTTAGEEHDAVYCAWNEQPGCVFALGSSTAGNFLVRTGIAQKVGWRHRDYEADGRFIEAVVQAGARIVKVTDVLYTHNAR